MTIDATTPAGPATPVSSPRIVDETTAMRERSNRLPVQRARTGEVPDVLVRAAGWSWRIVVVIAAVLVAGWAIVQIRAVVIPVFVAVLLTALLTPAVGLLERRMPRIVATWIALLTVAGLLVGLGWLLQAPIMDATSDLADSWDATVVDAEDWLSDGPLGLSDERIASMRERLSNSGGQVASGLFGSPTSAARRAVDIVGGFFLTIVLTFFFLKEGREMWSWLLARLNPRRRPRVDAGGRAAFAALQGWIRGVAITGVVDAVVIGTALVLLGVPAAIPLAVITFFGAFFPIVGATLAGALAALIALATQGPQTAVIVAIVVLVVQQVEGDVLLPIVMRHQVSLHPAAVLVALALGGALGGIVGALVAVPLTAAATAAIRATHGGEPGPRGADDPGPTPRPDGATPAPS